MINSMHVIITLIVSTPILILANHVAKPIVAAVTVWIHVVRNNISFRMDIPMPVGFVVFIYVLYMYHLQNINMVNHNNRT